MESGKLGDNEDSSLESSVLSQMQRDESVREVEYVILVLRCRGVKKGWPEEEMESRKRRSTRLCKYITSSVPTSRKSRARVAAISDDV